MRLSISLDKLVSLAEVQWQTKKRFHMFCDTEYIHGFDLKLIN